MPELTCVGGSCIYPKASYCPVMGGNKLMCTYTFTKFTLHFLLSNCRSRGIELLICNRRKVFVFKHLETRQIITAMAVCGDCTSTFNCFLLLSLSLSLSLSLTPFLSQDSDDQSQRPGSAVQHQWYHCQPGDVGH